MSDRLTDKVRAQVTDQAGLLVWPDVLLARYPDRVDVWAQTAKHPEGEPHPTRPEFVKLATLPDATVEPVPRKGRLRTLVTADASYECLMLKTCCSAWTRNWVAP